MTLNARAIVFLAATAQDIRTNATKYDKGVPSPCMSVCQMDEHHGLCQGCLRTIDEISAWGNANEAFRRQVWSLVEVRAASLQEV